MSADRHPSSGLQRLVQRSAIARRQVLAGAFAQLQAAVDAVPQQLANHGQVLSEQRLAEISRIRAALDAYERTLIAARQGARLAMDDYDRGG